MHRNLHIDFWSRIKGNSLTINNSNKHTHTQTQKEEAKYLVTVKNIYIMISLR